MDHEYIRKLRASQKYVGEKLYIILVFMLIATLLMSGATYAWLAISQAPEVGGVKTNVGSNGSLEMALLSKLTYHDPTHITSQIGTSLAEQDPLLSNVHWGSVVDLSNSAYGLSEVELKPARLAVSKEGLVSQGILSIPGYAADGRFTELYSGMTTGVYEMDGYGSGTFVFDGMQPGYGVRAIGTSRNVSERTAIAAAARTSIRTYAIFARNDVVNLWQDNGENLFALMHYVYGESDTVPQQQQALDMLMDTANTLKEIMQYFESSLRQAIAGYAAVTLNDDVAFKNMQSMVKDKNVLLTEVTVAFPEGLPQLYIDCISALSDDMDQCDRAISLCRSYGETTIDKDGWKEILECLIYAPYSYVNDFALTKWDAENVTLGEDNVLTLRSDAHYQAPMHTVSAYAGEYDVFFEYEEKSIQVTTISNANQNNLLDQILVTLGNGETYAALEYIYGFALDFAFRCNTDTDLLLQTAPASRINGGEELPENQGEGSYMRFAADDMTEEQIVRLMDSLRVGFVDQQNRLLAIGKLNTSNYTADREGVQAALYLYDYTLTDGGTIQMGARRDEDHIITDMNKNEVTVITIIVWLDGDYTDNSMAATQGQSLTGMLNLQFASSADLNPAQKKETGD